ncbi:MAG: tRNA (adenosine(37)-N6)-threonylcarbamoyltransferase complex dimerization subunit type 1 TsaB [Chloroflexota bacterium]
MTLLAIDTATQWISLALHDGQQMITEQTWYSENHHTVELAPAIRTMLDAARLNPADLTAVAVAVGPGSYTGLRIGVALAKGMAAARELPLVGVSTLDILAAGQPPTTGIMILVLNAGRKRIVTARFQWRKGGWRPRGELENTDWETLIAGISSEATLSGEISAEGFGAIAAAQADGAPITLTPAAIRLRRAGYLAEEAWARLRANAGRNAFAAADVAPIYVKTKDSPV